MRIHQQANEIRRIDLIDQEEMHVLLSGVCHLLRPTSRIHPVRRRAHFKLDERTRDHCYDDIETTGAKPFIIVGNQVTIAVAGIIRVEAELLDPRDDFYYTTNSQERDALALSMASELQQAQL